MLEEYQGKHIDFHQLVRFSLTAIILLDDRKIVYLNQAFLELLGGELAASFLGRDISEFLHPDYHGICKERLHDVLFHYRTAELMEQRMIRTNGEIIDVEVMAVPHCHGGKLLAQVIIQDISERKTAERLAGESEKLAVAGQLAAGIAHEIRNPITAIKGFLQLMGAGQVKPDYLAIIKSELERIEGILSELLILSKPDVSHVRSTDLTQILTETLDLMRSDANLRGIVISEALPASPCYITCDGNRLKQVFVNFIKNAFDAMPDGGTLTVVCRPLGDRVSIRFTDNGIGIPEDQIRKLGEPFFTTKASGTGLGFMISKKIIEQHNGSMSIRSKVGTGTTIEVLLPK